MYVADSEADMVVLMQHAQALSEIVFKMASRLGQKAREVRQQLWTQRLKIPAGKMGSVWVTCIVARP